MDLGTVNQSLGGQQPKVLGESLADCPAVLLMMSYSHCWAVSGLRNGRHRVICT